jgi:hypothetical protein
MQLKIYAMAIATLGLLFLGACSSSNQTNSATNSPVASAPAASPPPATPAPAKSPDPTNANKTNVDKTAPAKTSAHGGQGGQIIESGPYHLELLAIKEGTGIHLDFFLQKGDNHEPIPNAKVTAQVQLPDGSQKSLDLKYDASGKHYYAVLPSTADGEYKVAILSDIKGEKVNARYSFRP